MTNGVARDGTKIDVVDQNFASPKRKDCKLDMDLVQSNKNGRTAKSSPVHAATTSNGKRNHKNVGGTKLKKASPAITKYFNTNGHSDCNGSVNSSSKAIETFESSEKVNGTVVLANDIEKSAAEDTKFAVPTHNGCVLMSPEAKSLQNSSIKQTTPHRIVVCSSPTKKQRPYAKDPVEVFSNLNIRDGATKTGRKGQTKTRRKLNINAAELHANGNIVENATEKSVEPIVNGDNIEANGVENKVNATEVLETKDVATNNNDKAFSVPKNAAPRKTQQNTQLTDYFPIRRSARKTKKAVEQEISQHIEKAIEMQLEDGLIVKMFSEKGRGIVAGRPFQRGEFVVEYIGELIDQTEADRREEEYSQKAEFGCYMYYFKHKEQQWW